MQSMVDKKITKSEEFRRFKPEMRLTCVCVNPKLAANSARSGNARYCVRWNRRFNCCNCNELYMVRGFRIFFPLPFTRKPVSSHLSATKNHGIFYCSLGYCIHICPECIIQWTKNYTRIGVLHFSFFFFFSLLNYSNDFNFSLYQPIQFHQELNRVQSNELIAFSVDWTYND